MSAGKNMLCALVCTCADGPGRNKLFATLVILLLAVLLVPFTVEAY